jgi:hypothetical protein
LENPNVRARIYEEPGICVEESDSRKFGFQKSDYFLISSNPYLRKQLLLKLQRAASKSPSSNEWLGLPGRLSHIEKKPNPVFWAATLCKINQDLTSVLKRIAA